MVAVPASFIRKLLLGRLSLSRSMEHLIVNFSHRPGAVSHSRSIVSKVPVRFVCLSKCVLKTTVSMVKINHWSGCLVYDFAASLGSKIFLMFYLNAEFLFATAVVSLLKCLTGKL